MKTGAEDLRRRLEEVHSTIRDAMERGGRRHEIRIVGVTKYLEAGQMLELRQGGLEIFAENRMQAALPKLDFFGQQPAECRPLEWHFIGPIQRNKVRRLVGAFSLLHAIDSLPLAQEVDRRARAAGLVQRILLQVNISGEENKQGFAAEDLKELWPELRSLPGLAIEGLMGMAAAGPAEEARPAFRRLHELRESLADERHPLPELSMGMSGDFEVAVEEGATLLRIGRLLYA